jgi:outer membrane protein TolC
MILHFGVKPDHVHIRRASLRLATPHFLAFIALMAIFVAPANAERDVPLTIAEVEDLALAAEPGQLAMQARAAAYGERAIIAGDLPDPTLRIGLNNYPIQSGGFTTEGMTSAGLIYRQTFPAGKSRSIGTTQFEFLEREANQDAEARGRNVLMAARNAWLEGYFWGRSHELIVEARPFFDDLATITRSLYAVGRKNQQDVLRAELELSRIDDRLIEIERQQARARAALGEWVGVEASRPIAAVLPAWASVPPLGTLRESLSAHPTLMAADAQISAKEAGVDLADERSKSQWALDVAYSYRDGSLPNGDPRSDFVTVGVTVGLPFFSKKSVDSTLSAALQERSAAQSTKVQVERELQSRLESEIARWQDLSRRIALYEERILGQTRDHAQAALLAYQSDRSDFADVMRGYIDDLNTRIDFIRLQVERAQSYAVLANLGGFPR